MTMPVSFATNMFTFQFLHHFYTLVILFPIRPLPTVSHRSDSKRRLDLQTTGRIEAQGPLGS
jgi:hypothetical protein